jgi:hypothetical protein
LKNHWLNAVGAALCGRPLTKGFPNSGAHRGASLRNSKGISVFFLVIAMLLMVTIGYVFSYLIPTKQKSVIFPIQSTQAFFIAQSGVEFAVRYAITQTPPWTTTTLLNNLNDMTRDLGSGRFILKYNYATYGDTLISIGEVPNANERRRISVSNFTSFLSQPLILAPGYDAPCWCQGTARLQFFIQNVGSSNITINAFSATWHKSGQPRFITQIEMGTPLVTKFLGPPNYATGNPPVNFNQGGGSQTITPGQVLQIVVNWDNNTNADTIVFIFYDTLGGSYRFPLDDGTGPKSCPAPC